MKYIVLIYNDPVLLGALSPQEVDSTLRVCFDHTHEMERDGRLFVNGAQAVKYALFENGRHPETIVETAREIELDMGGRFSSTAPAMTANASPCPPR